MVRPFGRTVSSVFVSGLYQYALRECMNEICALFHACEAVSAAILRRGSIVGDMADTQIKSRARVRAHGEVFTAKGRKHRRK